MSHFATSKTYTAKADMPMAVYVGWLRVATMPLAQNSMASMIDFNWITTLLVAVLTCLMIVKSFLDIRYHPRNRQPDEKDDDEGFYGI